MGGAEQHQLPGAQRSLELVRDREQAAEPLQERPDRRDVGPSDEPHRAPDRVADRERREQRRQGQAAGVDDDQRPAAPREVLGAADGDVPSQTAGGEGAGDRLCESHPQSSTSPSDQSRSVRAVPAAVAPAARAGSGHDPGDAS